MGRLARLRPYAMAALPGLGGIAIVICFLGYSHLLSGSRVTYFTPQQIGVLSNARDVLPPAEFRARLLWGTGSAGLVMALIWNLILSTHVMRVTTVGEQLRSSRRLLWTMAFAIATVCSAVLYYMPVSGDIGGLILKTIQSGTGVPVWHFTTFTNILTAVGVTFMATGAMALLLPISGSPSEAIIGLRRRIHLAKLSLYSASALLVVGVFQLWALYTWPASFLARVGAESIRSMGNSVALAAGMFFSGWLIVLYLPNMVVHQTRVVEAMQEVAQDVPDFDADKWLRRNGMDTSALLLFNRVAVILAPILTGALTHLLD